MTTCLNLLTVVSLKGFQYRVSVVKYEPMLLFYQITINLVRVNTEKTGGILLLPPDIKIYKNVIVVG